MNKVILIGRLTRDPDTRYTTTNNKMIVSFGLAVNKKFAKKDEEGQEIKADFFNIVTWQKTAEFVQKYFRKGQQIGVIGRLETRHYTDKDGKTVYVTEVIAEEVYFADSRKETTDAPFEENIPTVTDDDFPF